MSNEIFPHRFLFTMLRVRDLEVSISFYRDMLGMSEIARETFEAAKFTAVYMGYGSRAEDAVLELTYNWDNEGYAHGTAFGNVSLAVDDVYALEVFLLQHGVAFLRPAGELSIVPSETGKTYTLAHVADPDGYRVELIQTPQQTG